MQLNDTNLLQYLRKVVRVRPLKQKISITVDEDIIKNSSLIAEACDRSLSQYINIVLKNHLVSQKSTLQDTLKLNSQANYSYIRVKYAEGCLETNINTVSPLKLPLIVKTKNPTGRIAPVGLIILFYFSVFLPPVSFDCVRSGKQRRIQSAKPS